VSVTNHYKKIESLFRSLHTHTRWIFRQKTHRRTFDIILLLRFWDLLA